MTVVAITGRRIGLGLPRYAVQEQLGWQERIDFSDPRRRVLRELGLERREILRRLRGLRRSTCDRRPPVERDLLLHELRQSLFRLRKSMLALRATFEQACRLPA